MNTVLKSALPGITAILISAFCGNAFADSEGPQSPTVASGANWKSPSNVFSSDNQRTSYNSGNMDYLKITSFGFSSSAGIIDGIKVEIEGYGTSFFPPLDDQIDVALTKDGANPAGNWKTTVNLPNGILNENYTTCGGASDLWGASWSAADITGSDFGVIIRDTDSGSSTLYLDHVTVTVYFTPATPSARRLKIARTILGD